MTGDKQSRKKSAVVSAVPKTCRHHAVTVVVVMTSSVTTFSVSTTEMYPRRLAMDRAVFPLYKTRGILFNFQFPKKRENRVNAFFHWYHRRCVGLGAVLQQHVDDVCIPLLRRLVKRCVSILQGKPRKGGCEKLLITV